MFHAGRAVTVVLTVTAAALGVAACGGSDAARRQAASDPLLARSHCMRAHGIHNFPDPVKTSGGEGFPDTIRQPDGSMSIEGISFSGPAFTTAEQACASTGTAAHGPRLTEARKESFIAQARCIRRHGLPEFPDPVFGPAGFGVQVPLSTGQDPDSPAILRAEKACAGVGTPLPGV
jgi:hypothetical protein